jgi:hypothetical protein
MRVALKGIKRGRAWSDLVGYSVEELRAHLERQFVRGMGWHNISEWDIDHIIPLSEFHITSPFDPAIKQCWGLPNLRPSWRSANQRKHSKRVFLL